MKPLSYDVLWNKNGERPCCSVIWDECVKANQGIKQNTIQSHYGWIATTNYKHAKKTNIHSEASYGHLIKKKKKPKQKLL